MVTLKRQVGHAGSTPANGNRQGLQVKATTPPLPSTGHYDRHHHRRRAITTIRHHRWATTTTTVAIDRPLPPPSVTVDGPSPPSVTIDRPLPPPLSPSMSHYHHCQSLSTGHYHRHHQRATTTTTVAVDGPLPPPSVTINRPPPSPPSPPPSTDHSPSCHHRWAITTLIIDHFGQSASPYSPLDSPLVISRRSNPSLRPLLPGPPHTPGTSTMLTSRFGPIPDVPIFFERSPENVV
ncbi:hypothetical protein BDN67DRAFT_1008117 [Paxillus ammoniavirescens]|nr:hypothetical protein BDN67DRAFT_1008117 [Paxillus ammoniavirescens]